VKKYLAIVLGVLLVLSFAVVASAQDKPEITLGGKILVRGWYFDNIGSVTIDGETFNDLPIDAASQAMYSTNVYLTIDAKVAENVHGFMELETGSATSGLYYWGKDSSNDSKADGHLWFRQAWVQYTGSGLLSVPTSLKAGHMLLTLGEKQFLNHERFGDDAILLTVEPTKELLIGLLTAKLNEGENNLNYDDIDAYVLLGTYKIDKDNTVGLNYTLVHSDGNVPTLGAAPNVDTLNLQNLGLHANGKVTGLSYAAEVDFQFGKAKDVLGSGEDAKFSGYGILAKLGYKVDPVNLRASFAMGSGDSDLDDNKIKEFQTLVGTDYGATARFPHYTQLYERAIKTAAIEQGLTGNERTTGIANTTYYNLGLDVDPVKDLSLSLDGYIIRATKAWYDDQSKSVGTEVDLTASYKIAKNLSYFVQAGVFTPGQFYNFVEFAGKDKKTATMAVHGLSLTF
jgi:hypothetical protein